EDECGRPTNAPEHRRLLRIGAYSRGLAAGWPAIARTIRPGLVTPLSAEAACYPHPRAGQSPVRQRDGHRRRSPKGGRDWPCLVDKPRARSLVCVNAYYEPPPPGAVDPISPVNGTPHAV